MTLTISRACYANRTDVLRAPDMKPGIVENSRIDRALISAAEKIDAYLHRVFYPRDTTYRFDWPSYQYAYPWRVWFDRWDLQVMTDLESPLGTVIPLNAVISYPLNKRPGWPARAFQLDRSQSYALGGGPTPQASVWVTGTWGFTVDQDAIAPLAVAISSSSQTTVTLTDGSQAGPGDVLIISPGQSAAPFPQNQYAATFGAVGALTGERVIVQDIAAASTGLTQSGGGVTTPSEGDNQLSTTGAGTLVPGEVIILDAEQMLVTQVIGGVATVVRPWNGTVLATHSGAAVSALRAYTVLRGQLGTTAAASWTQGTAVSKHRPPGTVRDLNIAEAINQVLQETAGYARTVGGPDVAAPAPGVALADLWAEAVTGYGRQVRVRQI